MNQQEMSKICLDHYQSYEQIQNNKIKNFHEHLEKLCDQDKQWWFGDINVQHLTDLDQLPIRTTDDIIAEQQKNPPYGLWDKGSIVFTSSASTNGIRKSFKRSLENYYKTISAVGRCLENHGVNKLDSIMSSDPGAMFMGHTVIEDAAVFLLEATRIKNSASLLTEKLKVMDYYGVTVFSGSPGKLLKLAKLNPKKKLSTPLKLLINTGGRLDDPDMVADAFGVSHVVNMYGSSEMGNIAWSCKHQYTHVNIDTCHIEQGKYFSNLTNLPIFRYLQGEQLEFSFKGTCDCGSNLPTVDKFISNNTALHKD
jgi:phenylacetate-coenzyme A ligase PaaK-like adenylate-forming protein